MDLPFFHETHRSERADGVGDSAASLLRVHPIAPSFLGKRFPRLGLRGEPLGPLDGPPARHVTTDGIIEVGDLGRDLLSDPGSSRMPSVRGSPRAVAPGIGISGRVLGMTDEH
jgi:hypothetical protein